jgi:hypothetical protein
MVVENEGTFEVNGHSLYTKSWLVRHSPMQPECNPRSTTIELYVPHFFPLIATHLITYLTI